MTADRAPDDVARRPTAAELIAEIERLLLRILEHQEEQRRLINELSAQLPPDAMRKTARPKPRQRLRLIPGGRAETT